jgi:hypothetical protein
MRGSATEDLDLAFALSLSEADAKAQARAAGVVLSPQSPADADAVLAKALQDEEMAKALQQEEMDQQDASLALQLQRQESAPRGLVRAFPRARPQEEIDDASLALQLQRQESASRGPPGAPPRARPQEEMDDASLALQLQRRESAPRARFRRRRSSDDGADSSWSLRSRSGHRSNLSESPDGMAYGEGYGEPVDSPGFMEFFAGFGGMHSSRGSGAATPRAADRSADWTYEQLLELDESIPKKSVSISRLVRGYTLLVICPFRSGVATP